MNIAKSIKLLVAVSVCLLAGFVGSIFTTPAISTWYITLNKPALNPPNWIFAPVWTTLFILMGISLFLVLQEDMKKIETKIAIGFFAGQLILNILWSILFFGFHSPLAGLIEIGFLWIAILFTIISFWRVSKVSAILLLPYLFWVSFASILNFLIWELN
ncbi:TspO protein [candidate division WOR-1 bacterium RIFOXYA2_FULL_36_21]|uniref:TspO protein n=1 Tax=candidate division WOR-1 bacterium RIFOXYB2_FULL_36_35 TaxID=1802578 RepID=A0A1F4S0R8_UNCSA|nr:MAG: TspO protein [candidate division WOR-1 bacterium RIFOXYA2_FULL_36_21]OGC14014.1 MAG: TspO protein [candidate division WOR-1 bacterium RIFOXYB2_FULL_36_35]OGC14949.1 MAG: TspO protein [candidate division WOR-1 bacterium RIFOXYA12_FULL_36_13]